MANQPTPPNFDPLETPPWRPEGASPRRTLLALDITSTGPLPNLPGHVLPQPNRPTVQAEHSGRSRTTGDSRFWLNGDVLLCACPDCSAPMTVRLWLMLADCWQCGVCIELTEEEEREALRVWEQHRAHEVAAPAAARVAEPARIPEPAYVGERGAARVLTHPGPGGPTDNTALRQPHIQHVPAAPPRTVAPALESARRSGADWLRSILQNMPAWLISLLFHILLLTILGLLREPEDDGPLITLSTRISRLVREGGHSQLIVPSERAAFDLGVPDSVDLTDPAQLRAVTEADQVARELRLASAADPQLPDLQTVRQRMIAGSPTQRALAARDPRIRVEMVQREGGTTFTEAAVARGLRWLAKHQNRDGSWSLDRFHRAGDCDCGDGGNIDSREAATALALLPFLGAGQTHLSGLYRDEVASGLRWLLQQQKPNGDLRGSSAQYPGMYAQGQATIVLCEAFYMTGDEALRTPAQLAVDFIAAAQYEDGGWRYHPRGQTNQAQGDTSVVAWQLMALQSGLAAGLTVPEATLENASHFLDTVTRDDGASYSYLPRENATAPMTAAGHLCRIYLGWKRNHPALRAGVEGLLELAPPDRDEPNIYYWYYATQTMHHYGGDVWNRWNEQMRDVLVETQEKRGHAAGSWSPNGPLTAQGGRLYMTSLAICSLEVYYRHLPIFRQIELE